MRSSERKQILQTLKARFEQSMPRHAGIDWADVTAKLEANPAALESLQAMESTASEPDIIGHDPKSGQFTFCGCAPESPTGRRSTCYDGEARAARKENKPDHSAIEMAASMGIDLLTEAQYRALQKLGDFDLKTSSLIKTPLEVRALGGALFCDRRHGQVHPLPDRTWTSCLNWRSSSCTVGKRKALGALAGRLEPLGNARASVG